MEMTFDEAIGIARQISPIQRRMLLDLETWPDNDATTYNRGELLWKELIVRATGSTHFRLTERGTAVATALRLNAISDEQLLETHQGADPASLIGIASLREIEERRLLF